MKCYKLWIGFRNGLSAADGREKERGIVSLAAAFMALESR